MMLRRLKKWGKTFFQPRFSGPLLRIIRFDPFLKKFTLTHCYEQNHPTMADESRLANCITLQ